VEVMSELKWYVLRAVSGQEKKVKAYLDNEISRQSLEEHIPQVLIPTERVYELKNGKKKIKEKNFFPGYILIQANVENGETLHLIKNIPGVIGFLGTNKNNPNLKPVALRESEINRILGKVDESLSGEYTFEDPFIKGESVKVMDGPFNGFTGTIEEIFEDRKKLQVTVKIFGRNTPLELSYTQVEKIQNAK